MRRLTLLMAVPVLMVAASALSSRAAEPGKPMRGGIIGLDTSHCVAFTALLNKAGIAFTEMRVVAPTIEDLFVDAVTTEEGAA